MTKWGRLKFALDLAWNLVKSQFESKNKIRKYLAKVMSGDVDLFTEEMNKLKGRHPKVYEVVVSERDLWLSEKVRASKEKSAGEGKMRALMINVDCQHY